MGGSAREEPGRGTAVGGSQTGSKSQAEKQNGTLEAELSREEARASHCLEIARGAAVSAVAYGVVRAVTGDSTVTEDVVDLCHSAYTSSVSISGIAALEPHDEHVVALPARSAGHRGAVVRMFCHSIGYFGADVLLIAVALLRGKRPNLWQGRLAHHAIQACANLPVIFQTKSKKESVALRSVLCIAYFAEFSNIFLRLSNMLRRANNQRALRPTNVALVLSFGASRIINFPFAIYVFCKARHLVSPSLFKLIVSIQAAGYALNLAWFFKIVNILRKQAAAGMPSIEC